jgi:hypothetical protein
MGVSGQHHAPAALLPPGKGPPVPSGQEAGWAPEPVWIQRLEEKDTRILFANTKTVSVMRDSISTLYKHITIMKGTFLYDL